MSIKNDLEIKDILKYHKEGWLGPFDLMNESKMSTIKDKIYSEIIDPGRLTNKNEADYLHNRHLDNKTIWDLCSNKKLIKKVNCLFGKDLICFRSNLQFKKSEINFKKGEGEFGKVPWHQDSAYYTLLPNLAITGWIAITDSNINNGCLRIIPSSHLNKIPHDENKNLKSFDKKANNNFFDINNSIDIELKAGQFILFNVNLLHSSNKNMSGLPRLGLSPRITTPYVFFPEWETTKVLMLSGKDYLKRYKVAKIPK